jgi:hypothetical protein
MRATTVCYKAGMRVCLKRHPDSICDAVTRIDVDVTRSSAGRLLLRYAVTGKIGDLRLPAVAATARADELWQHTCFEAFVGSLSDPTYYELNFAPSTQWAAYRFDGYRSGMSVAAELGAPRIEVQLTSECFTLGAALDLGTLRLPADIARRFGLSAVIEEANGRQSYWALAHPPGKADFHHADCFTQQLPPA